MITITKAIRDENLFRPFLANGDGDISSWSNWMVALRVIYGLPITKPRNIELVERCTGRDVSLLPENGFDEILILTGRRSGKSKISSIIAGYEAIFSGKEGQLSKGEQGLVPVISPSKLQSTIVKRYIKALFESAPMLENEIVEEQKEGFLLSNGIRIQILTGDYRSVRGFSLLTCVCDEICFFGLSEESKVRNDTELVAAIRPSLITLSGKLICISTKYAQKGWAYKTWKRCFGNDKSRTLVWDATSKMMNPLLDQRVIDAALLEDPASARTEFLNKWREDIEIWLPRSVIELVVRKGRKELLPQKGKIRYAAFADVSGGRSEGAGLAIAHKVERKVVIDFCKQYKAPHSPYKIVELMAEELRRFGISKITGDNYSAQFVADAFAAQRIKYKKSELPKSGLYLELLPRICSKEIELLDDETSITQLAGLERRTRSGGKDKVDHPTGAKDDLANAIAGVATVSSKKVIVVGGF